MPRARNDTLFVRRIPEQLFADLDGPDPDGSQRLAWTPLVKPCGSRGLRRYHHHWQISEKVPACIPIAGWLFTRWDRGDRPEGRWAHSRQR
jgi:hypothetical protein